MKTLDDHIEEQNKFDADGQGRECFICHGNYYITAGLEDICGTCLDCAQEAVRDALRYRYLRARHDPNRVFVGFQNGYGISQLTADLADEMVDSAMSRNAQFRDEEGK